jgi:sensor histidine kinase YesM
MWVYTPYIGRIVHHHCLDIVLCSVDIGRIVHHHCLDIEMPVMPSSSWSLYVNHFFNLCDYDNGTLKWVFLNIAYWYRVEPLTLLILYLSYVLWPLTLLILYLSYVLAWTIYWKSGFSYITQKHIEYRNRTCRVHPQKGNQLFLRDGSNTQCMDVNPSLLFWRYH